MELRRAAEFGLDELTRGWNLGYTDYFVPVSFSEAAMASWMKAGQFDLAHSLVLTDGPNLVGFSYLGVQGRRGWIGGFGISPDYRGKGLARQLFADHVSRFPEAGVDQVQLEVMVENWAQKVYAGAGFRCTRRLLVLRGTLPNAAATDGVCEVAPAVALAHSQPLHGAYPACWQREVPYLQFGITEGTRAFIAGPQEEPTAMLLCQPVGDRLRILDAAGSPEGIDRLIAWAGATFGGQSAFIVNEPEGSPVHQALLAAGFQVERAQFEMHWP